MTDEPDEPEQELLERLQRALAVPDHEPPPEGIAAVRAAAAARATEPSGASDDDGGTSSDGGDGPDPGDGAVVPEARPMRRPRSPAHRRQPLTGRRDLLVGGVAAAAGVAFGVGGAVIAGVGDDDEPELPPTEAVQFSGGPAGVTSEAKLINHEWGIELMLDVAGLPADREYSVAYLDVDGGEVAAGSLLSVADEVMKCRFNGALLRDRAAAIELREASDGAVVLRSDLA